MLDKIINILERLEYPINYRGASYLATTALFRDGDNPRALLVYEDGLFDQIEVKKYSWPEFVSKVKKCSIKDANSWLNGAEIKSDEIQDLDKLKVKMPDKLFEKDYEGLIKSYKFYLDRGISKETLDNFGAGLAQGGPMYGRICFCIRDKDGTLRGAAGRDVLNRDPKKKWKIKGKKSEFIYPYFDPKVFSQTGQICLVESIGDCLSLWNSGIKQVICIFGLSISQKVLSFIVSENPDKIFISLNNDFDKDSNRGQNAAEKIISKLSIFFDASRIINSPPTNSDFGEQSISQNIEWAKKYNINY